ncbi:DUF6153 family protein [Streptomyces sp. NPDC052023]|uniref:DUF6153 family protein n=1 Tax=Streptomyces sp. NPDC052023 TaxID=3365681 RepID=UPI0037D329F8
MSTVTGTAQPSRPRPAGRGALLLAVLAGLLAMHGLAPGVPTAAGSHTPDAPSAHAVAPGTHRPGQACAHAIEDGAPGHVDHADASCSAGGIGTSYAPPLLTLAVRSVPDGSPGSPRAATGATEGGRAPPDLAELQLLRI